MNNVLSKNHIVLFIRKMGTKNILPFLVAVFNFATSFNPSSFSFLSVGFLSLLSNLRYILMITFIIVILINAIKKKYSIIMLVLVVITLFYLVVKKYWMNNEFLNEMDYSLIAYLIIVVACVDVDYRKVISCIFISSLITQIVKYIMVFNGVISSIVGYEPLLGRVRNYFGNHPNSLSYAFYYMVLSYIYIRKEHACGLDYLMLIALTLIHYYLFATRSVLFLTMGFIFLIVLSTRIKLIRSYTDVHKYCLILIPIVLPILLLLIGYFYEEIPFIERLYWLFSGRLNLIANALSEFKVSIFGAETVFVYGGAQHNYLDSSLFQLLFKYGLIIYIPFTAMLVYFATLINEKRDIYLFYIFIFSLALTSLNGDFSYFVNPFLFVLSYKHSMIDN